MKDDFVEYMTAWRALRQASERKSNAQNVIAKHISKKPVVVEIGDKTYQFRLNTNADVDVTEVRVVK